MPVTNSQSGTRVDEVGEGIYRIHTPVADVPGGFSFNQYLLVDEDPLLFHAGPRSMFPLVREAIASVMPVERLRWIGFSHHENDESGAINKLLAVAPAAQPLTGRIGVMLNSDCFDRPARGLDEGERLSLGRRQVRWLDTPHLPHAWECGYLFEEYTATLLCGDLFTQGGSDGPAVSEGDILGPSEQFRGMMDYYSHTKRVGELIAKLASTAPKTLACMHGSAWRGDGASLLRALGDSLAAG